MGRTQDAVEILDLHGRYSFAADEGSAEEYASIFTEDGVFVGRVGEPDEIRIVGRAALVEFAKRAVARRASRGTRHHHSSPVFVELNDQTALTRSYLLVTVRGRDDRPVVALSSIYEDKLVKTPHGWLIRERRALPDVKGRLQ